MLFIMLLTLFLLILTIKLLPTSASIGTPIIEGDIANTPASDTIDKELVVTVKQSPFNGPCEVGNLSQMVSTAGSIPLHTQLEKRYPTITASINTDKPLIGPSALVGYTTESALT